MKQRRELAALLLAICAGVCAQGWRASEGDAAMRISVDVGGKAFSAVLAGNEAARAFAEMMRDGPLSVRVSDYGGFEKVGSLGKALPANDRRMTTSAGDIVLYNRSQIVAFYGSNTWSYTPLARIENLEGWRDALGQGAATLTFSLAQAGN